jgi:Flp pilus assembly protein TadD
VDAGARLSAWWVLAGAHTKLGDVRQALADYDAILKAQPNDVAALNNAGVVLMDAGRYDEALARFRAAARLAPGQPLYWNNVEWAEGAMRSRR